MPTSPPSPPRFDRDSTPESSTNDFNPLPAFLEYHAGPPGDSPDHPIVIDEDEAEYEWMEADPVEGEDHEVIDVTDAPPAPSVSDSSDDKGAATPETIDLSSDSE